MASKISKTSSLVFLLMVFLISVPLVSAGLFSDPPMTYIFINQESSNQTNNTCYWDYLTNGDIINNNEVPIIENNITQSIISQYKFDGDGTDSVGSNDMSLTGSNYVTMPNDLGFNFYSSAHYGIINSTQDFNFTSPTGDKPFSIVLNMDNYDATPYGAQYNKIIDARSNNGKEFIIYVGASRVRFYLYDNSTGGYIGVYKLITFTNHEKYHLAFTYDGSGTKEGLKIYYNTSSSALLYVESGTYEAMEYFGNDIYVARAYDGSAGGNFQGVMDDLTFYDKELSSDEVSALYDELSNYVYNPKVKIKYDLDVGANVNITDDLFVGNDVNITNDVTIGNDLFVSGSYDWTSGDAWNIFDGHELTFNQSMLNNYSSLWTQDSDGNIFNNNQPIYGATSFDAIYTDGSSTYFKQPSVNNTNLSSYEVSFYIDYNITASSSYQFLGSPNDGTFNSFVFGSWSGQISGETFTIYNYNGGSSSVTYIKDNILAGLHTLNIEWNDVTLEYDIYLDGTQRTTYTGTGGHAEIFSSYQPYYGKRGPSSNYGEFYFINSSINDNLVFDFDTFNTSMDNYGATEEIIGINSTADNKVIIKSKLQAEENAEFLNNVSITNNLFVYGNLNVTGCICYDAGATCLGTCV
jgi:hypothetical protein